MGMERLYTWSLESGLGIPGLMIKSDSMNATAQGDIFYFQTAVVAIICLVTEVITYREIKEIYGI